MSESPTPRLSHDSLAAVVAQKVVELKLSDATITELVGVTAIELARAISQIALEESNTPAALMQNLLTISVLAHNPDAIRNLIGLRATEAIEVTEVESTTDEPNKNESNPHDGIAIKERYIAEALKEIKDDAQAVSVLEDRENLTPAKLRNVYYYVISSRDITSTDLSNRCRLKRNQVAIVFNLPAFGISEHPERIIQGLSQILSAEK